MSIVVDTNVIAYYLLGTQPFYPEVRRFWRATSTVLAPDSWRVELLNVLFLAVRAGVIDKEAALRRLYTSEGLVTLTVPLTQLRSSALELAVNHAHPAYDTVFVALSLAEKLPLATYDQRLIDTFPSIASRPEDILATRRA